MRLFQRGEEQLLAMNSLRLLSSYLFLMSVCVCVCVCVCLLKMAQDPGAKWPFKNGRWID